MDTLGALALATEPPNNDMMKRMPVGRKGNFISNVMWRNIFGQSLYQFIIIWYFQVEGENFFGLEGPESGLTLNTLIFNSFVFCQVLHLFIFLACFAVYISISSIYNLVNDWKHVWSILYVARTFLSWNRVVFETCQTRVSDTRVACIFKNLSCVYVSCTFQCCRVVQHSLY